MAHRGRLNVLAHNLGRPYDTIFAEFEGASTLEAVTTIPQGGTGDVKYHHGAQGSYELPDGRDDPGQPRVQPQPPGVRLPGRRGRDARRADHARRARTPTRTPTRAVPIVIHGDAAFPAQGVVAETLNLQALDGYKVGGTVHLITNNQIGFTTDPDDARSTRWASDLAKGFDVPIIHVNADDVRGLHERRAPGVRVPRGVRPRRADRPDRLPPLRPQRVRRARLHPARDVREDQEPRSASAELWAERLVADGVVTQEEVERQAQEVWDNLTLLHQRLKAKIAAAAEHDDAEHGTGEYQLDRSPSPEVDTAVPAARLRELGEELLRVPDGFTVHPKLVASSSAAARRCMRRTAPTRMATRLARSTGRTPRRSRSPRCSTEGTPIRLTGQDTERGTFSQRHLVLHDAKTGQTVCPIQSLPDARAPFELHNSPLSELACLGFEYGYSQEAPETLVLWEAQFGDFVNSAQVIVDQFIVSGLAKWGQTSRLTLLLPHGYEGSGPEHSSARLERFLALAAEGNIRVANPTTPAQYFHLLRRQALDRQAAPAGGHDAEVAAAPAAGDAARSPTSPRARASSRCSPSRASTTSR